jgi:hypothetical protein
MNRCSPIHRQQVRVFESFLKVEHFSLGGQVDQVGPAVQHHVGEESALVNLTRLGAGNSDTDGNIVLHQIPKVVIGTITGGCFDGKITARIRPHDAAVNEKQIYRVPFFMGDFGELKTAGCFFAFILAQYKEKIRHDGLHYCIACSQ